MENTHPPPVSGGEVILSPAIFFGSIVIAIVIGIVLGYFIATFLSKPKKIMVIRDERGRLEGIIETG